MGCQNLWAVFLQLSLCYGAGFRACPCFLEIVLEFFPGKCYSIGVIE